MTLTNLVMGSKSCKMKGSHLEVKSPLLACLFEQCDCSCEESTEVQQPKHPKDVIKEKIGDVIDEISEKIEAVKQTKIGDL